MKKRKIVNEDGGKKNQRPQAEIERRRIVIVLSVVTALFLLLVLYLTYFQIYKAHTIADNPYNPRLWVDENLVTRGSISDRNKETLAYTERNENGKNYRVYQYGELYAHIIGYSSSQYGKTGLEKNYNNLLLNISDRSPLSELKDLVIKNDRGNNLVLTIDNQLQQLAYDQLSGHKGSVVAMNPTTGEVYAMVSRPSFNPNSIERDWNQLVEDTDGILLNRATQGLYAPGSVFKVITATALLEEKDRIDLSYEDKGKTVIVDREFSNVNDNAYGEIDLRDALVHSSNVYFADKSQEIGGAKMQDVAERFLINKKIPFDIATKDSIAPFASGMGPVQLAAASFGQGGDLLVTPLNMACMIAAVANDGKLMKPFIVKEIVSPEGNVIATTSPVTLSVVTSPEVAAVLKEDLVAVVDDDSKAKIQGVSVGGKTGTAENASDKTHAWFVAFAPAEQPQVAVAVILEEDGTSGGETAAPIAKKVMEQTLRTIGRE